MNSNAERPTHRKSLVDIFKEMMEHEYPLFPLDLSKRVDGSIEFISAGTQHMWNGFQMGTKKAYDRRDCRTCRTINFNNRTKHITRGENAISNS